MSERDTIEVEDVAEEFAFEALPAPVETDNAIPAEELEDSAVDVVTPPPGTMAIRDYQDEVATEIMEQFKTVQATMAVMATGLGKTRVASEVIHRFLPGRSLFLCHRLELVMQGCRQIERATGLQTEIEMADLVASTSLFTRSPVVVATIQTLISGEEGRKRMHRFRPEDFDLLVCDEFHHFVSKSFLEVLNYFRNGNPNIKVLGLTATPSRHDEQALGKVADSCAAVKDLRWAFDNGWLVNVKQQSIAVRDLDYSHVRTTAGDLNGADLAAVLEAESIVQEMVQGIYELGNSLTPNSLHDVPIPEWSTAARKGTRRKSLIFATTVKHAEMLSDILNRIEPNCSKWVCGKTPKDKRKDTFQAFSEGAIQFLTNVGVATEGYDCPNIEMVFLCRPTKSTGLFQQMIGRGTRTLTGLIDGLTTVQERIAAIKASAKPHVTVCDFVGNAGKHSLVTPADVLGGNYDDEVVARVKKRIEDEDDAQNVMELLEEEAAKLREEMLERKRKEEARKARLVGKTKYSVSTVDPFAVYGMQPDRERGWDSGRQLSPKQRDLLLKQGIDPQGMPYGQAKQILDRIFKGWNEGLATFKQCKILKRAGVDTSTLKMAEASKLIDELAKNRWQRPASWDKPVSDTMGGAE